VGGVLISSSVTVQDSVFDRMVEHEARYVFEKRRISGIDGHLDKTVFIK